MRLALFALAIGLVGFVGWSYLPQPGLDSLDAETFEVRILPWGEENANPLGVTSSDPDIIAELVAVLRAGVETEEHKCGPRGTIVLRRSFDRSLLLEFLPGHQAESYEFRFNRNIYRVPRSEFVHAMQRFGVEVPLGPQ